jgi:peptidoglycan/xylan/chitin deacetylase (PgdA/CDA1 family)
MSAIPVLLYHRIAADRRDRFAVAPELFSEHLAAIEASARTSLTIGEYARCLRGCGELPARPVVISFDDGYAETPAVLVRLAAEGLRTTLYVTTGAVDAPGAVTSDDLLALSMVDGVELGAHTVSHPHLDALPDEAARAEITSSKRALEDLLDRPVDTFAYPHGAYGHRVRRMVIEAGYGCAAAVKNALSHRADDPWAIARYTCTSATTGAQLERVLAGAGVPLAWSSERLRTRAARTRRRLAHRVLLHTSCS